MIDRKFHIGFTGTRSGMTDDQHYAVSEFLVDNQHFLVAHHGDCVGADSDFHFLVRTATDMHIVGHPPIKSSLRAFCGVDEDNEPKDYLDRDRDIVDASGFMIVVPGSFREETRSGTWYTARYARSQGVHGLVFWPNGTIDDLIKE